MSGNIRLWHSAVSILVLASTFGACRSETAVDQILTPVRMEFEELFALEDSVQLDTSVLIGSISMLDINSMGELLVQDNQSNAVHVFSSSGTHLRTLSITDCNPEATLGFRGQSTYLDDSRIFVLTTKGAMVFDQTGRCTQSSIDQDFVTNTWSVCAFRDTIFAMPLALQDSTHIRAYGSDLTLIDQFPLPAPRFPRRANTMLPLQGRTMGCFDDDVWWVYGEDFDATRRLRRAGLTQFRLDSFRNRTKDYPAISGVDPSNWMEVTQLLDKAEAEASSIVGMFVLDEMTRLVIYDGIESDLEERTTSALIASHEGVFWGVGTLFPDSPSAAKDGMLYFTGDPEDSPDGEVTNPTIIRYQFIPPGDNDD